MTPDDLNRRGFLVTGTGLFVFFWTGPLAGQAPPSRSAREATRPISMHTCGLAATTVLAVLSGKWNWARER